MQPELDNIPDPSALLKRRIKSLTQTQISQGKKISALQKVLSKLLPLSKKAMAHVSDGHEFKAKLYLEIEEGENVLRDQGVL